MDFEDFIRHPAGFARVVQLADQIQDRVELGTRQDYDRRLALSSAMRQTIQDLRTVQDLVRLCDP